MYEYNTPVYGMHAWWWVFWAVLWVGMFSFWTPVTRRRLQDLRETPREIIKRRLAKGEINEQEYENLKVRFENDQAQESPRSPMRAV